MNFQELDQQTKDKLFVEPAIIETPFNKSLPLLYADATASGKPSPIVEKYVETNILPYYANTHSNAFCGHKMSEMIKHTKEYIRRTFGVRTDQAVIFTGNGATGAINHLAHSIDYTKYSRVNILISRFEHYSNFLPWVEIVRKSNNVKLLVIPIKNNDIDITALDSQLEELNKINNVLNIVTITACSNVTGVVTNLTKIGKIVHGYGTNNCLFADFASLAPYHKIDCSKLDAIFVSGHKFVGGFGTPGILIANKKLFMKDHPYMQGGGTVSKANEKEINYFTELEEREIAGTPNIVGIIKLLKVLEIKDQYQEMISNNEKFICQYVHQRFLQYQKKNPNFQLIFGGQFLERRLPTVAFAVKNMHYNLITTLLSDMHGIQTRGGISCCGLLASHLKEKEGIDGWCRITFSWYMSIEEINKIIDAVIEVINSGEKLKAFYTQDKKTKMFGFTG